MGSARAGLDGRGWFSGKADCLEIHFLLKLTHILDYAVSQLGNKAKFLENYVNI